MNSGDPAKMNMQPTIPEEEEVDDEDMGVAETYSDYMPTKRMLFNFIFDILYEIYYVILYNFRINMMFYS